MVMNSYYAFSFVNIFLGGIIAGSFLSIIDQLSTIGQKPFSIVTILGGSIPAQSNFYLNYVLAQGLFKDGLKCWNPIGMLILMIKEKWLAKTPRAKEALYGPTSLSYHTMLPVHCFMMLLVLTFSTNTPLLLPISLLYFGIAWLYEKYTIVFQSEQSPQMGGILWVPTFGQIFVALVIYNIVMIGVFAGASFIFGVVVAAICLVMSIVVWWLVDLAWRDIGFYGSIQYPLEHTTPLLKDIPSQNFLPVAFAYVHPALLPIDPDERFYSEKIDGGPSLIWGDVTQVPLDDLSSKYKKVPDYDEIHREDTKRTKGVNYV